MDKIYFTISETAYLLGETAVTVRFWSNTFSKYLRLHRNAKGNRFYTQQDIDILRKIQYLTRECGLSLDAVAKKLASRTAGEDKSLEIRDSLLRIRAQLVQIKESL